MSPRVSDDGIAQVRERANLVEIVSRYVGLKRSGRNHMGLCPFHGEKTPSFSVSGERGFFHCFGCGESGDVFKFLMKIEGLTFPEALETIAREVGVELPRRTRDPAKDDARERALRATAVAAEYFRRTLWGERSGEAVRAYLREREIREPTAQAFGLGFAPPQGLVRALEAESVPIGDAEAVGLVARSREGGWYDRFRNRLVFPIHDLSGHVVGFGGRLLGSAEGQPKYLNSPESAVFHKGRLLYGLAAARDAIRKCDQGIVVEGYVDVIALAQAGVANVVAPLGTALTADQVRLLHRFTDRIVVLFDGDDAGRSAAARSFAVFAEAGLFADAAFVPAGDDPDTLVRREGADAVQRCLAGKTELVDHYLASLAPKGAELALRQRGAVTASELLARTGDPIFAGFLARRAAEHFGIAEAQLLGRVRRPSPAVVPSAGGTGAEALRPVALSVEEARIVELLLVEPSLRTRDLEGELRDWLSPSAAEVLRRIVDAGDALDPSALFDALPQDSRDRVAKALLAGDEIEHPYGNAVQAYDDCLRQLRNRRRKEGRTRLLEAIRAAEACDDDAEVRRLQSLKMALDRERE